MLDIFLTLPVTNSIGAYSSSFLSSERIVLNLTFNSSTVCSYGNKNAPQSLLSIPLCLLSSVARLAMICSYCFGNVAKSVAVQQVQQTAMHFPIQLGTFIN